MENVDKHVVETGEKKDHKTQSIAREIKTEDPTNPIGKFKKC